MNRRRFVTTMCAGIGGVFVPRLPRWRADDVFVERWSWVMGQPVHVMVFASSEQEGLDACAAALAELRRVERRLTLFDAASDLCELNRRAGRKPMRVDRDLGAVLAHAGAFRRATGGAFDVAVEPLMRVWGFHEPRTRAPAGLRGHARGGGRGRALDGDAGNGAEIGRRAPSLFGATLSLRGRLSDQLPNRLPQLVNSLLLPRARHDHLVVLELERTSQLAFPLRARGPGQRVAFRERREHRGLAFGEQLLHRAVVVGGLAADVEQPEDAREQRAIENVGDEPAEGGPVGPGGAGVAVTGKIQQVIRVV